MKKIAICALLLLLAGCCPEQNGAVRWCESHGGELKRNASGQFLCVSPDGKITDN